jgi:hypothetical protein
MERCTVMTTALRTAQTITMIQDGKSGHDPLVRKQANTDGLPGSSDRRQK